jgi:hypothetical protein
MDDDDDDDLPGADVMSNLIAELRVTMSSNTPLFRCAINSKRQRQEELLNKARIVNDTLGATSVTAAPGGRCATQEY